MRLTAALLALAALAAPARAPAPLDGDPLPASTGLRLLVADSRPFVVDVDAGTSKRLDVGRGGVVRVVPVEGRAGVVAGTRELHAVRGGGARVASLGYGSDAWPAGRGRGVWVLARTGGRRCTIARVALDGRRFRAPRLFPCPTPVDPPGGDLGLVVGRTRIVDPGSGRTVLRTRSGILAVAGRRPVLAKPNGDLVLADARGRVLRTFRTPSALGGVPQATVDPAGRYVALEFGDPAWGGGGRQVTDVWILDTHTRSVAQLPGLPAFVALKFTSIAWARDGRLVLLAETETRTVVAVWRPNPRPLALKTVRIPRREGGSDSFAVLG